MTATIRFLIILLLSLITQGCATTYVPVSWGFGDKVQQLSRSDLTLVTLYERYDPERSTLRVNGESFDEVMMPSQVKYHLGAYRPDTKLIYRNLYHDYTDLEMRDLLVHEFSHHVWFNHMSQKQQQLWRSYLAGNPSPLQAMVRSVYPQPNDWATEDFAFVIEYARRSDIEELVRLELITAEESAEIIKILPQIRHAIPPPESFPPLTAGQEPDATLPDATNTGTSHHK